MSERDEGGRHDRRESISHGERVTLLRIARDSLESWVRHGERSDLIHARDEMTLRLRRPSGCFVTLHKRGRLRGCVGDIQPERPLYQVVRERAISAASHDSRFPPVTPDELNQIDIELSVLTRPRRVSGHQEIELGRHGIIMTKGSQRAVFLPQVPLQQGWDVNETLDQLARKAGLSENARHDGSTLEVFEALILKEDSTEEV